MGGALASIGPGGVQKQSKRVLLLGFDGTGKTTLLYKLKLGETVVTTATIGFNVETIDYRRTALEVYDLCGKEGLRTVYWCCYLGPSVCGIIWVIDSTDHARLAEANDVLNASILSRDDMRTCPLLLLANKQDSPQAMPTAKIASCLHLEPSYTGKWYVQGSDALRGDGLSEGLEWLIPNLR